MILVTGGAGFIGSNLIAALAERGHEPAACDRLDPEKAGNLDKVELAALIAPEDLADFLEARGGELSAVFHLGAATSATETDEAKLERVNNSLPQALWTFCALRRLPFIYASSAATYGDGRQGFDDELDLAYLRKLKPLTPYGRSKNAFDIWVAEQIAEGAAQPPQWAGLKFFNVYGPNEYHKGGQASVAWHLFRQMQAGDRLRLFRSHHPNYVAGGQRRDFVWVGDCVHVMLWLLEHPKASGLFNVGTGEARSFNSLAEALFAALGRKGQIDYIPTPEAIRPTYQYFTEARMERLREIGYGGPFASLEDGVARYVQDYLIQDDPYR